MISAKVSSPSTRPLYPHLLLHNTQPKSDNITDLSPLLSRYTAENIEEDREHLSSHTLEVGDTLSGILLIDTEVVQQLVLSRSRAG